MCNCTVPWLEYNYNSDTESDNILKLIRIIFFLLRFYRNYLVNYEHEINFTSSIAKDFPALRGGLNNYDWRLLSTEVTW